MPIFSSLITREADVISHCINPASLSQKHANYGHSWLTTSQILNTTPNVGHLLSTWHPVWPQVLDSVIFLLGLLNTTAPGYPISDVSPVIRYTRELISDEIQQFSCIDTRQDMKNKLHTINITTELGTSFSKSPGSIWNTS